MRARVPRREALLALGVLALVAVAVRFWYEHQAASAPPRTLPEAERRARTNPTDLQAQLDLGEMLFRAGRMDEADQVFSRAAQLAPRTPRVYLWRGMVAVQQHRPDAAKTSFEQSLQLDPNDADVWRALGELQQRDHQGRDAITSYEHVTKLRPQDAVAWKQLGALEIAAKLLARAQDALHRALSLDPADRGTQLRLGLVDASLGDLPEARQLFEQVLAKDPTDADALTGSAEVALQLDPSPEALARAEAQLKSALARKPSGKCHLLLGRIALLRERPSAAVPELKQALALDPSQHVAYTYLSQAYAASGQAESARKAAADYEAVEARLKHGSKREAGT